MYYACIMYYASQASSLIIYFVWVAAHVDVEGNEVVDQISKQALKHTEIE